jgi:2'-5' RNA ligase
VTELTRAFVAVEISEGARRQIADLLGRLRRETVVPVRWVRPELMHLTLAFLGEVSGDVLESAKARLGEVAQQHKTFTAQLKGLGAFPSPGRARVVWLGTEQGRDEVCALQADVVKALRPVGYQPERRPFSPHLTIGRLKIPADVARVVASPFESESFIVGRVVLFRSVLGPGGPTYSLLSEFPLPSV